MQMIVVIMLQVSCQLHSIILVHFASLWCISASCWCIVVMLVQTNLHCDHAGQFIIQCDHIRQGDMPVDNLWITQGSKHALSKIIHFKSIARIYSKCLISLGFLAQRETIILCIRLTHEYNIFYSNNPIQYRGGVAHAGVCALLYMASPTEEKNDNC